MYILRCDEELYHATHLIVAYHVRGIRLFSHWRQLDQHACD